MAVDPKSFLWKNVVTRLGMNEEAGVDAVLARLPGVTSRGTIQRIREKQTSVGTDKLLELAEHFGVEVWQLLLPSGAATSLSKWPFSPELADAIERLAPDDLRKAENALRVQLDLDPLSKPSGGGSRHTAGSTLRDAA